MAVDLISFRAEREILVEKHRVLIIFGEKFLKFDHLFSVTGESMSIDELILYFLGVVNSVTASIPEVSAMVCLNILFQSLW